MERVMKVRARLASLRQSAGIAEHDVRKHVRAVVLVVSASRGGSSFLAELLRGCSGLIHLRGELNPLLALCAQTYPASGTGSDLLTDGVPEADLEQVGRELGYDWGARSGGLCSEEDVGQFALDLACRLTIQWPDVDIDLPVVSRCLRETLAFAQHTLNWPVGKIEDLDTFHVLFLSRLRDTYPSIHPGYYDIDQATLRRWIPDLPTLQGPPGPHLLEEPPFICIEPWRVATPTELAARPLVIKTPSNAYRIAYLKALFPNARIRILHLTRNPAASINGLWDGWVHGTGFFSHRVSEPLSIRGYSDVFPDWGRSWWNFDLPPNWRAMRELPLQEVCALQWLAIHRVTLDYLAAREADALGSLRLRFEDIVRPDGNAAGLPALEHWLRAFARDVCLPDVRSVAAMPPVMATAAPRAGRWRKRADHILPLTHSKDVREISESLGYAHDPSTWI
jgi:hypothetical protein